jgi:N-acetylmuramoyl-L-alanine amidase
VTLSDKKRALMLQQAVESNLDAIHDRLPRPVRRATRWSRRAHAWAAGAVVVMGLFVATSRGGTVRPPAGPSRSELRDHSGQSKPLPPATLAATARPFSPGVLGLTVRRVVIDAGHGGASRGTVSADGVAEDFVTLDIARRMRTEMHRRGFTTVMTREADETVSLQRRAAIANTGAADVFVSIHLNAFRSTSTVGIETYYLGPSDGDEPDAVAERENEHTGYSMADLRTLLDKIFTDARRDQSRQLAVSVQRALVRHLGEPDAPSLDRGVKKAPFVVLVATEMPAVLAEVSCLSNQAEAERLNQPEYRQRIAAALASGVEAFARARG